MPGSAVLTASSNHLKRGWEHTSLLNSPPCSRGKPSSPLKPAIVVSLSNTVQNSTFHRKDALKQNEEYLLRVSTIKLQEDKRTTR